jgi:hypothetical protein
MLERGRGEKLPPAQRDWLADESGRAGAFFTPTANNWHSFGPCSRGWSKVLISGPWREEGKAFFSEEKNQKTFIPALTDRSGQWPPNAKLPKDKSLLLLFFRKEGLAFVAAHQNG